MHPTFISSTAKHITKLTDKAKAALDERWEGSSKKCKNDDGGASVTGMQPKKVKSRWEHGKEVEEAPPKVRGDPQRQLMVCTEEEEDVLHAIIISDDADSDANTDNDKEVNMDEEASADEEESAEDELSKPHCESKAQANISDQ